MNGWAMMGNHLFALNSECWAFSLLYTRIRIILLLPPLFPPTSLFLVLVSCFLCVCIHAQLSLTLCNHMDGSLPGSSVRGVSQTRILEWVAISFSRGSSWPRDWTQVSCIAGSLLYFSQVLYWLCHQGNPFYFLLQFKSTAISKASFVCSLLITWPWIRHGLYQWQMLAIPYSLFFLLMNFLQITLAHLYNTGEENSIWLRE